MEIGRALFLLSIHSLVGISYSLVFIITEVRDKFLNEDVRTDCRSSRELLWSLYYALKDIFLFDLVFASICDNGNSVSFKVGCSPPKSPPKPG